MLNKVAQGFNAFYKTLREGRYKEEISPILKGGGALPQSRQVSAGSFMLGMSRMLGLRWGWTLAAAVVSLESLLIGTAIFAAGGAAFFAMEYRRCLRTRNETIEEVNFAGQTVVGTRADLCRLHHAQKKIMTLQETLSGDADTHEAIKKIIDTVAPERSRVRITNGGRYHAGTAAYEFTEPKFKLVHDDILLPPPAEPEAPLRFRDRMRRRELEEIFAAAQGRRVPASPFIRKLREQQADGPGADWR